MSKFSKITSKFSQIHFWKQKSRAKNSSDRFCENGDPFLSEMWSDVEVAVPTVLQQSNMPILPNLICFSNGHLSQILWQSAHIQGKIWEHRFCTGKMDHHRGAKCTKIYEGAHARESFLLFTSLTWLKESFFRVSSRYLQKVITSQGSRLPMRAMWWSFAILSVPSPEVWNRKGTESSRVGPRNQFFRILCSELIFRKLNQSKVSNTGSVHHTLQADIQLTGIQLYWVKMSTKDTSFHSFFCIL